MTVLLVVINIVFQITYITRFNYVSMKGRIEKDISNAFNKLKITRDEREIDDVSDETLSLLKPKT